MKIKRIKMMIMWAATCILICSNTICYAGGESHVMLYKENTDILHDETGIGFVDNEADDSETKDINSEYISNKVANTSHNSYIYIDNENIYKGMEKTYASGYIPTVKKNKVTVVIPLQSSISLANNQIRTTLDLGTSYDIPFVRKNYQKNFSLKKHKINNSDETSSCYLVTYSLELKKDRINGSYPVVLSVYGADKNGNEVTQEFTIYVTISDGKDNVVGDDDAQFSVNQNDTDDTLSTISQNDASEEQPQFMPKIMVQSYTFTKLENQDEASDNIQPGDAVTAEIIFLNTSKEDKLRNMTVTVGTVDHIQLLSATDSIYIDTVGKNETFTVSYEFQIDATAGQGQYNIPLSLDYADGDGNIYTSSASIRLSLTQSVNVQFDELSIQSEIEVGKTVEVQTKAINLGKGTVYNVRAEIEADGLNPAGTMFIGDIEAGTAVDGTLNVNAIGRTQDSMYGETEGTITFYYEDESGKEYSETKDFSTNITSPISVKTTQESEDKTSQWWIIMAVILFIILIMVDVVVVKLIISKKNTDKLRTE
jgi:hypothetical protein